MMVTSTSTAFGAGDPEIRATGVKTDFEGLRRRT
jgi:hypothetical protein